MHIFFCKFISISFEITAVLSPYLVALFQKRLKKNVHPYVRQLHLHTSVKCCRIISLGLCFLPITGIRNPPWLPLPRTILEVEVLEVPDVVANVLDVLTPGVLEEAILMFDGFGPNEKSLF